jgi:hypothetical protein
MIISGPEKKVLSQKREFSIWKRAFPVRKESFSVDKREFPVW